MSWEPLPTDSGSDPQSLAGSLERLVRHLGASSASSIQAVFGCWPELVGSVVAAHSRPVRLQDGMLSLVVDEPVWATQLRLLEADLLARLNSELGSEVVKALRVRVGSFDRRDGPLERD